MGWGPYLSERQWGTVCEDYSEGGDAGSYFTQKMRDENEFLSPFGIRSLSRYHADHPYFIQTGGRLASTARWRLQAHEQR
jgi:hypothetical protein